MKTYVDIIKANWNCDIDYEINGLTIETDGGQYAGTNFEPDTCELGNGEQFQIWLLATGEMVCLTRTEEDDYFEPPEDYLDLWAWGHVEEGEIYLNVKRLV